jgi:hypothetical protein
VEIETNVTLTIDNTLFNSSTGSVFSAKNNVTAIQIDNFPWNAAVVTVNQAHFAHLPTGILQKGGRVVVSDSTFEDVAVGFSYGASSTPPPEGFDSAPFSLRSSHFDAAQTKQTAVVTSSPSRAFVVKDNTCSGPTTHMQPTCAGGSGCVISNNPGC